MSNPIEGDKGEFLTFFERGQNLAPWFNAFTSARAKEGAIVRSVQCGGALYLYKGSHIEIRPFWRNFDISSDPMLYIENIDNMFVCMRRSFMGEEIEFENA